MITGPSEEASRVATLNAQLVESEKTVRTLQATVAALKKENVTYGAQIETMANDFAALQKSAASTTADLRNVKADNDIVTKERDTCRNAMVSLRDENEALNVALADARARATAATERARKAVAALEAEISANG